MKFMASSPITSWQTDVETMETVRDIILGGSKITADGDCSHEITEEAVPGPSVFPSGEPGVSGDFWADTTERLN